MDLHKLYENYKIYLTTEICLADLTVEAYTRDIRGLMEFVQNHEIKNLDHVVAENYLHSLTHLHQNSVQRISASIRSFYHFLSSRNIIDSEVVKLIDPIRKLKGVPHWLSQEEFGKLIAKVAGPVADRDIAIMELLNGSGIRISELCNLNVGDISTDTKSVRILGKGASERLAPLSPGFLQSLKSYESWRSAYAVEAERALFVTRNGNRVERREMSKMVGRHARQIGVKATAHTLRHSFATNMMNRGIAIETIASWLGHRSLDSTQIYLGLSKERLRKVCSQCHPSWMVL